MAYTNTFAPRMPWRPHTRRSRGFSLVEMALGLAVIAAAVVASVVWVKRIQTDQKLNLSRNDAIASMNAAVAAYATFPATTGATPQVLSTQNVWPVERMTGQGTAGVVIRGHFNGSREFMWANTTALAASFPAGSGFMYHITNVPQPVCAQLLVSLASQPNVFRAYAGTFGAIPVSGAAPAATLAQVKTSSTAPINMPLLSTQCGGTAPKHLVVAFYKT